MEDGKENCREGDADNVRSNTPSGGREGQRVRRRGRDEEQLQAGRLAAVQEGQCNMSTCSRARRSHPRRNRRTHTLNQARLRSTDG